MNADVYDAQDVPDETRNAQMKLREQMRAARAKYSGGVEVAEDDPLAKDKKKASKALKKVERTLANLPSDFSELPRLSKIPFERSRQSEFYRVFREGEEEMREAERLRELEKLGRPPNYDLLPRDERDRINTNLRKQRSRDRKRKPSSKPAIALLPVASIASDSLHFRLRDMLRSLEKWALVSSNPLAPQLRKRDQQLALIRAAAMYARYFNQHSKPPSRSVLANGLAARETRRVVGLMY